MMLSLFVLAISTALSLQALFSLSLMVHSWDHPERLAASEGPQSFSPPRLTFTAIVPARHERRVIYDTVRRIWQTNYPKDLLEVVVVCSDDDEETMMEARRAAHDLGSSNIQVVSYSDPPINKPHGLNVGLACTTHEVVTVFDAEDDVDADIFRMINTILLQQEVPLGIVQAGVQLMNFRDHWYGIHNCLEYYFWFKSRLHFHAGAGMIPLGGNTVFIRRELLLRVGGWDADCLTEDADLGIRVSTLGEPIRVVYQAQHVTREETPNGMAAFVRQRTRWHQGYLQVLRKRDWWQLPQLRQRALAFYTLAYPCYQALLMLLWPVALTAIVWLKLSALIAMISFVPLYLLLLQLLVSVVGAYMFTQEYGLAFPPYLPITMAITLIPFQCLLGVSAVRAVYRELFRKSDWEKTTHVGAHRQAIGI